MTPFEQLSRSPHDKLLFTPGPLTTSTTVKQAMLRDLGPRDHEFRRIIAEVREGLSEVAGVSRAEGYEAIPVQGSTRGGSTGSGQRSPEIAFFTQS